MRVLILGAGAFGTALALSLDRNGNSPVLWARDSERFRDLRNTRRLGDTGLPERIQFSTNLAEELGRAEAVVNATPSSAVRGVGKSISGYRGLLISATKGIEFETGATMSQVLADEVPGALIGALSGPSLAIEIARDNPCALVAASENRGVAETIQKLFHRPTFRVYTCQDVVGAELGGALKNVIAIAAGVCDGLELGCNAKASLTTRGLAEIQRLGVACGAKPATFAGLSGIGDLALTCFSSASRNRRFGEALGRLGSVERAKASSESLVEGIPTARSAYQLARDRGVGTPIIDETFAMIWQGKSIEQALKDLTTREEKPEWGS